MAKKKALRHYFDLIVKVYVEISEIIRGYQMPISDFQERERGRTKIGHLQIEDRAGVRTSDFFVDLINKWPLTKLLFAIENDFLLFFPSLLSASENKFKNTFHTGQFNLDIKRKN